MKYYAAYGSNLSIDEMKMRTPDAVIAGTGILKGWRLLFRKYATIKRRRGYSVPVLVWKISAQDEKNLDRYEGYPKFYVKKNLKLTLKSLDGQDLGRLSAMAYVMTDEAADIRGVSPYPAPGYLSVIKNGYRDFGFRLETFYEALSEAKQYEVSQKFIAEMIRRDRSD